MQKGGCCVLDIWQVWRSHGFKAQCYTSRVNCGIPFLDKKISSHLFLWVTKKVTGCFQKHWSQSKNTRHKIYFFTKREKKNNSCFTFHFFRTWLCHLCFLKWHSCLFQHYYAHYQSAVGCIYQGLNHKSQPHKFLNYQHKYINTEELSFIKPIWLFILENVFVTMLKSQHQIGSNGWTTWNGQLNVHARKIKLSSQR